MDEAHHGFVPNRGTDSGFLDLLNQLEKAQEWGISALLCSWDVKRAFDSVSRTVIRMALTRLGVPANLINMIHEMEVDGITIVRTPLTQYIYDTEGMDGLRKLDAQFPGILIHPERGVPQGDTGSPLIWLAVYDILLRALTIQRLQLADRLAHTVNYADDLKSIAGNLTSLQEQANLVSAFALVFGLDQSKTKFRAFRFPFDVPEDQRDQLPAMNVQVHKQGWQTDSVLIQSIGTLKDLGYYLDTDLGGEQQFKITLQRLTTALEAMKYKFQGSPGKEYTMRMVVMPRLAYTGQGANLAEAHLKRLDSVTLTYARKDLRLMAGFPTAPLIHHHLINYPLPSSIYYEARLGSLWRNLGREGRPAVIVQEHLDRALRTRVWTPRWHNHYAYKRLAQLIRVTTGSMDCYKVWRARSYISIAEALQPHHPQRAS